ncbi:MAG: TolC family protein [Candidatus Omnitrophica bacterium]|nr:TolC family protein [Candidatus Omnitrophota bacterium]
MQCKLTKIFLFIFIACFCRAACAGEGGRLITISQGIRMVLKDSRLIKIALPDNEMAYQDSLIARSALLPQLNANLIQTFNQYQPAMKFNSSSVKTADKDALAYGFDVYQTLFDFGKSLANWRASNKLFKAQKAHTQSVIRVATLEFIIAYFNLLEADRMIAVFQKEADSLTAYLGDIEHLYEQGVVVKNDLLPAKVRLADIKQKLIAAVNDREIAASRLNNILGLPLREKIMVQDIKMQPPKFPEMQDAWNMAQVQRPEVAFYSDQINSSFFSQRAKAVENFPALFVDLGYAHTQNQFLTHEDNASIQLGAKMNLYDGGATQAGLRKERSLQTKLNEQKSKIIEDIKFEIEDSYFSLKNACEKVAVATEALVQAEENVRFYRVKYQAGSATPTEVLDAITMQTKAQTNYYSDDYELKRSYAKLMYSIGIDLGLIYERMESEKNGATK